MCQIALRHKCLLPKQASALDSDLFRIEKAQLEITQTKQKYDKAVDKLEVLLTKRKERDSKELIAAFTASDKTLADVLAFLQRPKEPEKAENDI